jgi:hypothetical protein
VHVDGRPRRKGTSSDTFVVLSMRASDLL